MLPSPSEALDVIVMLAGAVKVAPLLGVVMLTVGGAFTVMFTGAEVVVAPRLSVARAVSA
jgi:hypothetical protein